MSQLQRIWAGNGTHTGQLLGYCPQCGLYHSSHKAERACMRYRAASAATENRRWRELKGAVANEAFKPFVAHDP